MKNLYFLLLFFISINLFSQLSQLPNNTIVSTSLVNSWKQAGANIPDSNQETIFNPMGNMVMTNLGSGVYEINGTDFKIYVDGLVATNQKVVEFPQGIFNIKINGTAKSIKIPAHTTIRGAGSDKTIFKLIFSAQRSYDFFSITDSLIGFENFKIDASSAYPSHYAQDSDSAEIAAANKALFYFSSSTNCWVKGVETYMGFGSHVEINGTSSKITIQGCYFNDTWLHGHHLNQGSQGYGISFKGNNANNAPNLCLIENNIIEKCRHNFVMQYYSYYNIIAYNYTKDARAYTYFLGVQYNWSTSDFVFHGNSPQKNLVEGNYFDGGGSGGLAKGITIDNVKTADNAPQNAVYRNISDEQFRIQINACAYNDSQMVVGNVMSAYDLSSFGHIIKYNQLSNNSFPASVGNNCNSSSSQTNDTINMLAYIGKSCYLDSVPCWMENFTLPLIGPYVTNTLKNTNPAKERYSLSKKTYYDCPNIPLANSEINKSNIISIYPNPALDKLYITLEQKQDFVLKVYDIQGKEIFSKNYGNTISVELSKTELNIEKVGTYIFTINTTTETFSSKIVFK